jgi:predicted ribosomally synthesized peptide with SipW-like signal peptide
MKLPSFFNRKLTLKQLKPLILLGCVCVAVIMLTVGTMAWFTAQDSVVNELHKDPPPDTHFSVSVVDIFEPDNGIKRVGAVNDGEEPALVRVLLLPTLTFVNVDGSTVLPATYGYAGGTGEHDPSTAYIVLEDLNVVDHATWNSGTKTWTGTADWAIGDDGYFYYLHVLQPGESTETLGKNLFNEFTLNTAALPAEYSGATLRLEVKVEGVLAQKSDYRDAWWAGATPAAAPLSYIDTWYDELLP